MVSLLGLSIAHRVRRNTMKYYTIQYPDENDINVTETLSEDQIIALYWDYWYNNMCQALGKDVVDSEYTKQDCIQDWCIIHWAVEVVEL